MLRYNRADKIDVWLQTTQPISGGAVTAVTNCCANCVEPSRTRWMAGAAPHKSG